MCAACSERLGFRKMLIATACPFAAHFVVAVTIAGRFLAAVVLTRCLAVLLLQASLLAARFLAALAAMAFASEALV